MNLSFIIIFVSFLSFMGGLIIFLRWHQRTYPDTAKITKRNKQK